MVQGSVAEQRARLEQAIAHMESQRAALGDAVVDASVAALQKELHDLEAAGQAEQRKLVTVLFMDTVGSTEMTRELDPEENLAIMDAAMQRLSPPVEQYGGRVVRYMGDGFKAVFGLPVAHEQDARMAVRAGLGILAAAQEYAQEVDNYQVRVGIDTGWVAVGGLTEAEGTIMGMAVNLAARLESAAPAGGLLISQHTYQHVRGLFDLRPHDPVEAKGFPDPVPVYQVLRAKGRSFRTRTRGVEGVETSMIGRDRELSLLQERLLDAVEESEGQFVTVVGEAGLGKSRLLYEFENWVDLQPWDTLLFRGRALPETQRLPYGLLRDLFAFRFNIQDDDSAARVREKIVGGIEETLGAGGKTEKKAHFVGHLLGYNFAGSPHLEASQDEPQVVRDRALSYIDDYFTAAAARSPVLILLEDLHWADESSLDALAYLGPALQSLRIMFLGAARHTLFERRTNWMEGQDVHLRLDLAPLSRRNSRKLVSEVLQRLVDVPDTLRDLVVGSAEGNPFYVEELVKMLVEAGAIVKGEPKWQVRPEKFATAQVPSTLTGVLQARLEGLPEQERMVLQQASVVGRVFWDRALAYINTNGGSELEEPGILDGLNGLREKEMIFRRELSAFAGANEHIFKHALLREVTYESVLMRVRQAYHSRVADWLIARSGERAGEITGLIADHLQQAGKDTEAVEYLLQAGDHARELNAHQEAIHSYRRALELLQDVGDLERSASAYMKLGLVYHNAFEYEESRQAYEKGFAELRRLSKAPHPARSDASAPHPLRIGYISESAPALDPATTADAWDIWNAAQLFSGLAQYALDELILPDIAESWEVLDNGRRYIFHLRSDARWSDGHPVTAGDFEFAWKRCLDPATRSGNAKLLYDVKGARAYHLAQTQEAADVAVRALDDWTLEVELEAPCSYFLQIVALPGVFPVPRHVVERDGPGWAGPGRIVHNGPFHLEILADKLLYRRNPLYHGQLRGNIEKMTILRHSDAPLTALYERDELDCLLFTATSMADKARALERHPGEYLRGASTGNLYLGFDVTRPPFDDPRVRRAIALATDRSALAETFLYRQSVEASGGFVPAGLPGHVADIALPFAPGQARDLLVEAGYPEGRDFPRQTALLTDQESNRILAQQLRSQWGEALNIDVAFVFAEFGEVFQRMKQPSADLWLMGYSADYPDPDSFLRVALRRHQSNWRHERYDRLIEKARGLMDHERRMELYKQAELILVDETPVLPLFYSRATFLRKPWLRHFRHSLGQYFLTRDIVIESH